MSWQPDWERIATVGTALAGLLGLGARQAYLKGKFDERMKDMAKAVNEVSGKLEAHERRLSDGAVAFGRIDEKLDALKDTTIRIENAATETNKLIIQHMTEGGKK